MKSLKQYINESSHWDWDDEANKEGKIELTTTFEGAGGRESNEVDWELEQLSDEGDYWVVRATVVKSDIPNKFKKDWYIEFDLYKDTDQWDIESELLHVIEDERNGAWSSGH